MPNCSCICPQTHQCTTYTQGQPGPLFTRHFLEGVTLTPLIAPSTPENIVFTDIVTSNGTDITLSVPSTRIQLRGNHIYYFTYTYDLQGTTPPGVTPNDLVVTLGATLNNTILSRGTVDLSFTPNLTETVTRSYTNEVTFLVEPLIDSYIELFIQNNTPSLGTAELEHCVVTIFELS